VLRLDDAYVAGEIARLYEADAKFRHDVAYSRLAKVARRTADRMARAFEDRWSAPRVMIAEAIYFQLLIQLCTVIPLRRLARELARRANGRPLLIVLPTLDLVCLEFWSLNRLEPLILCWALQREGADAHLLYTGPSSGPALRLTFRASRSMLPPRGSNPSPLSALKGRPLLAPEGIRGVDAILQEIGAPGLLAGSVLLSALPPHPVLYLLEPSDPEPTIRLALLQNTEGRVRARDRFSTAWPADPLGLCFDRLLGPQFGTMVARARRLLPEAETTEAHVCDHLFLGSSILAHVARERGGRVTLWPHSANPIGVDVRDGKGFDEVVVVTRTAGKAWKSRFPGKPVHLRPRLLLPPQRTRAHVDPSAPLTVIVFSGTHFMLRVPMLHVERHIQTYRRFFSQYGGAAACARLRFKPKGEVKAEVEWLRRSGVASSPAFEIETASPTRLDHPNMIYLSIDYGSTALLEGIARGVPCMIVREQPIVDYTLLSEAVVPIGDAEAIWACIGRCRDPAHYERLARSQIDWLTAETTPDGHA
jgi:hypothetical protein